MPGDLASLKIPTPFASCFRILRLVALWRDRDEYGKCVKLLKNPTQITAPSRHLFSVHWRHESPTKISIAHGETWAGRGAKPRWMVEALKKGKKIESFLIKR